MVHVKNLPISLKNSYILFPVPPQTQNLTVTQILRWIARSDDIYCLIPSFCETPCTRVIHGPQIIVSGSCNGRRLLASANTMRAQFLCCVFPPQSCGNVFLQVCHHCKLRCYLSLHSLSNLCTPNTLLHNWIL
jgi:hypothetical protein